jgi:hypothetical protein
MTNKNKKTQPPTTTKNQNQNPQPWDQLPTESPKHYGYFQELLKYGPTRTLKRFAEDKGLTYHHIKLLSMEYKWLPRARAFDKVMAGEWFKTKVDQVKEAEYRHMKLSHLIQDTAISILQDPNLDDLPLNTRTYVILSTTKAASDAVRMERLTLGEATEHRKQSDEGLNKLLDLVQKSKDRVEKEKRAELEDGNIIDAEFSTSAPASAPPPDPSEGKE